MHSVVVGIEVGTPHPQCVSIIACGDLRVTGSQIRP